MRPIPKELQAYFPKAPDPARPWWSMAPFPNGISSCPEWQRGEAPSRPLLEAGRVDIDKTDPIPPPPILVGQVWGAVGDNGTVTFEVLTVGTARDRGGVVYAWGLNVSMPVTVLLECGYLLRCPYGYAPWSGVEVVP